jgi:hypothetical protein
MSPNHAVERRLQIATAGLLATYFVYLNWDRAGMHFASDEMMNIAAYFRPGPWRLMRSMVCIWENSPRPLGGLFYLPLYSLFGLNPAPYQIVAALILAANGYWLHRFARELGCSALAAGLATLVGLYHPGLTNLHYNTDMIYDVLCFFFYFAAFVYYTKIRHGDRTPRWWEVAVFLVLYLAALNAKEMAVTLPGALLVYEWLYHRAARFRGSLAVMLCAGAMNLLYMVGKFLGPDPLARVPGYRIAFSWHRFAAFSKSSVGEILCFRNDLKWAPVVAILILLTVLAWRCKNPALRFCWWFVLIAPLPIEFLEGRGQGCLYIPMVGWAVSAAIVLVDALRAASAFLVRRLRRDAALAVLVAIAVLLWCREVQSRKLDYVNPAAAQQGVNTREMIRQLQALTPHVPPGGTVVFLHHPFEGWDMAFIAELVLNDRRADIRLQDHNPLPENEMPRAAAIFDYRDGRLVQLK